MPDQELSYTTADGTAEGSVVLTLVGPLTLSNMFALQNDLRAMKPSCLIMDLTSVPYMDSAGLGVLMNYYVSAQSQQRKFFLAGVNGRVRALFEMTNVQTILKIVDSVADAEAQA
jgi:anti-sigma B factor antagonist